MKLHPPTSTLFPYTTLFRSIGFTRKVPVIFFLTCGQNISTLFHRMKEMIWLLLIISVSHLRIKKSEQRPPRHGQSGKAQLRSEEHTSELQSRLHLVCGLLLE